MKPPKIIARHWRFNGQRTRAGDLERLDFTRAWLDLGPSPAGNDGPYLHVPRPDDCTCHRLYPATPLVAWRLIQAANLLLGWREVSAVTLDQQRRLIVDVLGWIARGRGGAGPLMRKVARAVWNAHTARSLCEVRNGNHKGKPRTAAR